jgi:thymidylate synthase
MMSDYITVYSNEYDSFIEGVIATGEQRFIKRLNKWTTEARGIFFAINDCNNVFSTIELESIKQSDFWDSCLKETDKIIEILKDDPASRQAVIDFMPISPTNLPSCFVCAQFFTVGKNVDIFVYMRSCDVINKFYDDLIRYYLLLSAVSNGLGLKNGTINVYVGSVHVYNEDVKKWETKRNCQKTS